MDGIGAVGGRECIHIYCCCFFTHLTLPCLPLIPNFLQPIKLLQEGMSDIDETMNRLINRVFCLFVFYAELRIFGGGGDRQMEQERGRKWERR